MSSLSLLMENCIDCERKADKFCTMCGLPVCNHCLQSKSELLCDDCYAEDEVWMDADDYYLGDR